MLKDIASHLCIECVCLHTHSHAHTCAHTHIHTHTHMCTHTFTHTCTHTVSSDEEEDEIFSDVELRASDSDSGGENDHVSDSALVA